MKVHQNDRGLTLLELLTVLVVVAILILMIIPALASMKNRAEKFTCMARLRGLFTGANAYVQQYGYWPQVDRSLAGTQSKLYYEKWIEAFLPFGITREGWVCPSIQREMGNPNLDDPSNYRSDYAPMVFDAKPNTPYRWPTMPWFVEKGDIHGTGNLVVLTNGSIEDVDTLKSQVGH